jgi:hypothetical protein
MMRNEDATADERPDPEIPVWAVELGCWTMVALTPLLYWVNGPAVSTDQIVVRSLVVGLALAGGITIRLVRSRRRGEACKDVAHAGELGSSGGVPGTAGSSERHHT